MAWSETDVQRTLTEALESYVEQFFNLANPNAEVSYCCRTPSARGQNGFLTVARVVNHLIFIVFLWNNFPFVYKISASIETGNWIGEK